MTTLSTPLPTPSPRSLTLAPPPKSQRRADLPPSLPTLQAGSQISSVGNDAGKLSTLKTCRDANAIICLVITVACGLVVLLAQGRDRSLPIKATVLLLLSSVLLVSYAPMQRAGFRFGADPPPVPPHTQSIASSYRLYLYIHTPSPSLISWRSKLAFYLLSTLPELLVTVLYLAVDLNATFDMIEGRKREVVERRMKKGTWNVEEEGDKSRDGQIYVMTRV